MRRAPLISAVLAGVLGLLGYRLAAPSGHEAAPAAPVAGTLPPPSVTSTDPVAVFQKAFWRRPSEGDRILHAERREWMDQHGLSRWQWFLVVRASDELRRHLKDDNAFGLHAAATTPRLTGAPEWFAFDPASVTTLQSRDGAMKLMLGTQSPIVYATSQGGGFHAGSPAAVRIAPVSSTIAGRLPSTAPPRPAP